MAADFLDEKRQEIYARLQELKPLVEEYERLLAASAALDGMTTTANPSASIRTRTPASRARSSTAGRSRGRPKGSGKRGDEALAMVKQSPGITIPEIAQKMGIKQNYLYRVLPGLADNGLVRREGRGWHPAAA